MSKHSPEQKQKRWAQQGIRQMHQGCTIPSDLLVVFCRRRKKVLARLVALVQGEAGQVVGEAVVGVGLGEVGENDKVLGSAAALIAGAAALHVVQ